MSEIPFLDDLHIPYIIKKKCTKNLTIRFNTNNELVITQPILMTNSERDLFLKKHLRWIKSHHHTDNLPHETYVSGNNYLLLGKKYVLDLIYNKHESVEKFEDKLIVYFNDLSHVRILLDNYRKAQAEIVFSMIFERCFKMMNLDINYPKLIIKTSKSRWGCCYLKKNEVMLNLSLIHTPLELIEYVTFHELVHFHHPDHSASFHHELLRYVPDEKQRRKELKNYSIVYQ